MNNLVFTMVARGFGWNLIRTVFAWLDSVIYTVFAWAMQLIFDIVNVTGSPIFQGFYENIQTRIYAILAIFMLFKITISLLSYLVNPDTVSDKERGLGKMATRVIISLVMLMFFPKVFGFMQNVQPHILEALPRVILGVSYVDNKQTADQLEMVGKDIAFSIYHGAWFNENCADGNFNDSGQCFMYGNDISVIPEHINDAADGDSSKYRYDYYPVIGLVIGIIATLIIVGICMDVAIRVFKLIILQIIAPIPILSYIDPKSSKDGAFSKWVKMLTSVYLDLFIKLGVVYFIILVINSLVINNTIQNLSSELFGSGIRGVLVLIALVIGLLFFAKEAPKFICDALGIKSSDNGKLFGGLGKVMAAGAIGTGAIGSAVASGRASFMADSENNKKHHPGNILKNVGAGLVGGITGVNAGLNAAAGAKDHHAKAAMDAMAKRNATALAAGAAGSTAIGRALATGYGLISGETLAASGERRVKALESFNKALSAIGSRAKDEMVKQNWTHGDLGEFTLLDQDGNVMYDSDGKVRTISGVNANYKSFMAAKNAAAAAGQEYFEFTAKEKDSNGNWVDTKHIISMKDANMQEGFLLKNNEDNYISESRNEFNQDGTRNSHYDSVLSSHVADAEAKAIKIDDKEILDKYYKNGKFKVSGRDSIKKTQDAISIEVTNQERKNAANKANDRFSSSGK